MSAFPIKPVKFDAFRNSAIQLCEVALFADYVFKPSVNMDLLVFQPHLLDRLIIVIAAKLPNCRKKSVRLGAK